MKEKIIKIETEEYEGDVYNLEVVPYHDFKDDQFYLDNDTGIVIHNCHPRDNIALRFLAKNIGLNYDLFNSVMLAREEQASNMANRLLKLAEEYNLPIVILGKSFKPGTDQLDGSPSMLVGWYVEEELGNVIYDPETPIKAVYLLGHMGHFHDYIFPDGSVILDPWRTFTSNNDKIKVIHYGNTRK